MSASPLNVLCISARHHNTAMELVCLSFESKLWVYQGKAAWYFLTLPEDIARQVEFYVPKRNGFGSVRVEAKIRNIVWKTSIFPDKKSGSYFLPVKAAIRKELELVAEQTIVTEITLLD